MSNPLPTVPAGGCASQSGAEHDDLQSRLWRRLRRKGTPRWHCLAAGLPPKDYTPAQLLSLCWGLRILASVLRSDRKGLVDVFYIVTIAPHCSGKERLNSGEIQNGPGDSHE